MTGSRRKPTLSAVQKYTFLSFCCHHLKKKPKSKQPNAPVVTLMLQASNSAPHTLHKQCRLIDKLLFIYVFVEAATCKILLLGFCEEQTLLHIELAAP